MEISTKTGALRRLTDDPADDWDPAFTPDGMHIVWGSNRTGNLEVWLADADGSNARQVSRDGVDAENPVATRDGWIVYWTGNPAKQGIWKIRQDGTEATRLVAGYVDYPQVSPDGQFVAYNTVVEGVSGKRVVRMADGAAVPFEIRNAFRTQWTPDGRSIAFLAVDEKGIRGVFAQDFVPGQDTSKSRRMLCGSDPDMQTETFGISPDGSRMTIAFQEQTYSLMIAERVPGVLPPTRRVK